MAAEARHGHRGLDHLLLKDEHALRLLQERLQGWVVVGHLFLPQAPGDVRMDGAALDGAGTDEGNLDDQVVDAGDFDTKEDLDLGPALDLNHADDIATLDHGVDGLVGEVNVAHGLDLPAVTLEDIAKTTIELIQAGVAEEVELDEARVGYGVLVPLTDVATLHRGLLDGRLLVHAISGDDDAAGMLAQMTRQAHDLLDQRQELLPDGKAHAVGKLRHLRHFMPQPLRKPAVHALGDVVDLALGEAQCLTDVADGAGPAVFDEGADHGGPVGGVRLEDVLEHAIAGIASEIEVDVRHVARRTVFAQEALHREVVLDRVDA